MNTRVLHGTHYEGGVERNYLTALDGGAGEHLNLGTRAQGGLRLTTKLHDTLGEGLLW
jgi:hypothetical protein